MADLANIACSHHLHRLLGLEPPVGRVVHHEDAAGVLHHRQQLLGLLNVRCHGLLTENVNTSTHGFCRHLVVRCMVGTYNHTVQV